MNVGRIRPGDVPPGIVADALKILGIILEERSGLVTAPSRAALVALAHERLRGAQHEEIIMAACRLAIATGDPALRSRVERLAADRAELTAMGVHDQGWIQFIQRSVRESRAGR